ncbi:MAG: hypothetical protein KAV83_13090 [Desulfobacterales bacterium]|nr:hypothetical protein [Desulfobacterales bacterium]
MIRKTASPKFTGGGGEVFETQVCALYLSHLLSGSIPFSFRPGNISRVDFQVKVDGWLFDDFLVTTEDEGGRVACTIKSSQIFGQETVPKAVIRDAWVQYLHGDSSVFERNKDFLLICTVTLPPKIRPRLHQLINMASKMVPEQLDDRLSKPNGYVSKELVSLYAQFRCPSEMINGTGVAEPLPGELLSRLRVREYDFQESDSRDLRDGLYFCGQILKDKSVEASRRLWDRLVSIVSERKPIGGGISRKELQDELIGEFELCDYPNFNADWELLREDCAFALELIQDTIGGSYRIPRDDEIHSFDVSFVKNDVLILSGPSGSGKSALVKRWLKAKKKSVEVVWASAPTLERLVPRKWGEKISLMNPLQDILSNSPAGERYAVLDALEQVISENQIENLRFLLSLLGKSSGPRWKIFITCQPEALNRIMHILVGRPGFSSEQEIKSLETIRDDQLNDLLSNFPSFRRLSFRPEFRPVLRNLKLLDLMARGFEIGEFDPSQWIGESDFMNWYWRTVITRANTKTARSQFLQSLAARQADRSIAHISLSELDPNDHSHVEELRLDGVLVIKEERIWFAHDIQADWARTRLLISKGENFIEFVTPKLHFPMWFKAIRLYALTLIEKGDDFASFSAIWQASQGQNLQSLRDLFIEGALFAGNPENALRRLEPLLFQNNGLLLRRLLKRFEFLLSVPDPKYRLLLPEDEQLDLDIYLSSSQRIPLVAQWLPILRWIIQHRDQCSKYAPTEVASIGFTWLSKMPVHLPNQNSFPCRKDLGEIVLGLAENLNTETWKGSWYHCDGKSSEIIYRSALYAAYEHPERVRDFALVACCRKPPPGWAEVKQN